MGRYYTGWDPSMNLEQTQVAMENRTAELSAWAQAHNAGFIGDGGGAYSAPKPAPAPATGGDGITHAPGGPDDAGGFFDQLPEWSYYESKSPEEFSQLSSQFRDIYEAPQRQALERKLEQALSDAGSQEERIRANYVAQQNMLREREQQQGRFDLESAIARGAGRSGVVPYLGQQRDQYYTGQLSGMGAQQMSELNAVANQLGLMQRQVPVELQQLTDQSSRIEAQELQRLQDLDYSRRKEHDQDQFARMLQTFDRTKLTPLEQLQLYLQAAEIAGMFPGSAPDIKGLMGGM